MKGFKEPKTYMSKLTFVKKTLGTHFHFFNYVPAQNSILLVLETKNPDPTKSSRFSFFGRNLMLAIEEAYSYAKHEIEAGAVEVPEEFSEKEKSEQKVEKEKKK
jgi:hypothetical protein